MLQKIGDELERAGDDDFLLVVMIARQLIAVRYTGKFIAHVVGDELDLDFDDGCHPASPSGRAEPAEGPGPAIPSGAAGD
jgi:hypothetical protein